MPLIPFSITFKRKRVSKLPSTPEPIVNICSPQAAEPVSVIAAAGYTGPKLVEDLVPLIIAAGKWTTYDLANMARISPAWLFPSRKALYSSLHCTTVEILRGLNKTLTRNPSLSEYIRHLRIEFQKVTRGSIGTDIVQLTSLVGELFSRLSQLKTLKVDGRVALEVFQEGLANLPPTAKLRDLKLGVKKGWNGGSRDGDSALLWTSGKTSAVKSLKLLHLDGISMRVETPWEEKRLPRRLKHLKLRNSYINDPYGLPESFPLTRLEVVNEFTHPRERREMNTYHTTQSLQALCQETKSGNAPYYIA
ncbi:hypothetical protein FRC03_012701 [Tulasnella sp. 419]|nr:hypothetical protein FRC03_012701 [Tulasnella sp. 419]